MLRAETRRGGENDEVDSGVDDLLIGVEADEATLGGTLDLLTEALDGLHGSRDTFSEGISDGPEDGIRISGESLGDGTISTTATADEADLNFVGDVLCFGDVGKAGSEGCCGAGFENVASVERIHINYLESDFGGFLQGRLHDFQKSSFREASFMFKKFSQRLL